MLTEILIMNMFPLMFFSFIMESETFILKLLSDENWEKKKQLAIKISNKEMHTIRNILTDNVTAERKHLLKLNILSYHDILFLFLSFFGVKRLS